MRRTVRTPSIVGSIRHGRPPRIDWRGTNRTIDVRTTALALLLTVVVPLAPEVSPGSASARGPLPAPPSGEIGSVVVGATIDRSDVGAVQWAIDRFAEAGLSLPRVRVSFHASTEPCAGAQGGFRREDDGGGRVLVCVTELGQARELKVKRTLLHELAHAWDHHALTDPVRAQFMSLRGLEGWLSGVPYAERAGEQAAEVITWGLMDRPILMGSLREPWSWEELYEGYVVLAGSEPPHGYVWSLFAAGHGIYAHMPSQLEIVQRVWDQLGEDGRRTDKVEVRFHRTSEFCGGAATQSALVNDRLHVQVCTGSREALTRALLGELGGVHVSDGA